MLPKKKQLPLRRALRWILWSTLVISGSTAITLLAYFHIQDLRLQDPRYHITSLQQTGPLPTSYLAELLSLSSDQPTHLYTLSLKEGREKLLSSPVIKSATMKKQKPNTLAIQYTLHEPIAFLHDFSNTAITAEGVVIPVQPFFPVGELPMIVVGEMGREVEWGKKLRIGRVRLALQVLEEMELAGVEEVAMVDVSRVEAPSFGRRELIVTLEDGRIVRFNPESWRERVGDLFTLGQTGTIIDLRVKDLAYIQE